MQRKSYQSINGEPINGLRCITLLEMLKNLFNNAQDIPNLSAALSLNYMFFNATSIGNESEAANWEWDISNILNLEGVFGNASSFNQDIGNWDTTGVETDDLFVF